MKRIVTLFILVFLLVNVSHAQTKEATSSSTEQKDIQTLKDKLAAKVAELRKKDQKAVAGTLLEKSPTKLKIKTEDNVGYEVKIDDVLTKVFTITGTQKKEIKVGDLDKNTYIIISGPIADKTITANYIYEDQQFLLGSGRVTEVNKTDFYLKLVTIGKEDITLDVDSSTKRELLNIKSLETETIGFSAIKEGDIVHFIIKRTGEEQVKDRYAAFKILVIPQEYFQK